MRYLASFCLMLAVAGCGETTEEAKKAVTAPVDNIQQNINVRDQTRDDLKAISKKNVDTFNDILDKKKH